MPSIKKTTKTAEQLAREEEIVVAANAASLSFVERWKDNDRLLRAACDVPGWEIEDCEEATNLLYDRFTSAHARSPRNPNEVFAWGGTLDDAVLIAIGFHGRAVFDYWGAMVIAVDDTAVTQMAMEERKGAVLQ